MYAAIKNLFSKRVLAVGILVLAILSALFYAFSIGGEAEKSSQGSVVSQITGADSLEGSYSHQVDTLPSSEVANNTSEETKKQLLYLIEEEKLAHNVYVVMYEKYGARPFENIAKSETSHQERVLSLLETRDIADPRTTEAGVFTNTDLQQLYDKLIIQGKTSIAEAYKVGVAIEELDIADIKQDLLVLDDAQTDIKTVLEALLRGSQNHLRAFSRQVR